MCFRLQHSDVFSIPLENQLESSVCVPHILMAMGDTITSQIIFHKTLVIYNNNASIKISNLDTIRALCNKQRTKQYSPCMFRTPKSAKTHKSIQPIHFLRLLVYIILTWCKAILYNTLIIIIICTACHRKMHMNNALLLFIPPCFNLETLGYIL